VVVLASTMFSLAAMVNAILAEKFDQIAIVPTFILTPLTYLGGVFYSIALLPEFWQHISKFNPVLYMVSAFRYGMIGYADVAVWVSIAMMMLFVVLFYLICWYLLYTGKGLKT